MRNKVLAFTVVFVMLFSMVMTAVPAMTVSAAAGSVAISDAAGLRAIANSAASMSGTYHLTQDIALTGNWTPLGHGSVLRNFSGTLDGRGFKITGLNVNRTGERSGLFRTTHNATIKDLTIELAANGTIRATLNYSGALAGSIYGSSKITNVTINGNNATVSANSYAGGLAGSIGNNSIISNSQVNNLNVTGTNYIGGFVGALYYPGSRIYDSFVNSRGSAFTSNITSTYGTVGGFAGIVYDAAEIHRSGAFNAKVEATGSLPFVLYGAGGFLGELAGSALISEAFAENVDVIGKAGVGNNVGGFVGSMYYRSAITNAYAQGGTVTNSGSSGLDRGTGGFVGRHDMTHSSSNGITNAYTAVTLNSTAGNTGSFTGNGIHNTARYGGTNYYDNQKLTGSAIGKGSGTPAASLPVGRATAPMKVTTIMGNPLVQASHDVYVGWNYRDIWTFEAGANNDYPILRLGAGGGTVPGGCDCGNGGACTCGPNCDCVNCGCGNCGGGSCDCGSGGACTCGPNCNCGSDCGCGTCGGGNCTCGGGNCECEPGSGCGCDGGGCDCGPGGGNCTCEPGGNCNCGHGCNCPNCGGECNCCGDCNENCKKKLPWEEKCCKDCKCKPDLPTPEKSVKDKADAWQKHISENVGQTADFRVTSVVPNLISHYITTSAGDEAVWYEDYTFVMTDTMSGGLTFNPNSIKIGVAAATSTSIDNAITVPAANYSVSYRTRSVGGAWSATSTSLAADYNTAENNKGTIVEMEIKFNNLIDFFKDGAGSALASSRYFIFEYSAALNEFAIQDNNSGRNEVFLKYGTDPDNLFETFTIETVVFTLELDVFKYAVEGEEGARKALAGAEFVLLSGASGNQAVSFTGDNGSYRYNGTVTIADLNNIGGIPAAAVIVSPAAGIINLEGLAAGTYRLVEIKAPDGYNKLENPISVIIDYNTKLVNNKLQINQILVNTVGDGRVEIENKPFILPPTGGIGRVLFYVIGGGLLFGTVTILFVRSRMKKPEDDDTATSLT
ncbi:MAG: SpaA isopeptide-forming pilin-related protein [Oscillospiraceae bacterium]|nr:SpaA isopeptide-forming pilin-related protein [Oscillospiraceae bacterium]